MCDVCEGIEGAEWGDESRVFVTTEWDYAGRPKEQQRVESRSEFQAGVVAERERVTRIIRELDLPSNFVCDPAAVEALRRALGVEDNQPGTTP